jgi:hypothetical protein
MGRVRDAIPRLMERFGRNREARGRRKPAGRGNRKSEPENQGDVGLLKKYRAANSANEIKELTDAPIALRALFPWPRGAPTGFFKSPDVPMFFKKDYVDELGIGW